jgi:RNA-directed DNA polymerase
VSRINFFKVNFDRPSRVPFGTAEVGRLALAVVEAEGRNGGGGRSGDHRFTALLHHIDRAALERAFRRQKRQASAGVDGITVEMYEQDLAAKFQDVCARIHNGRYRPQPVRRVYIPKTDGGQRPLGVPALEDKIVQSTVAELLSAVYEAA